MRTKTRARKFCSKLPRPTASTSTTTTTTRPLPSGESSKVNDVPEMSSESGDQLNNEVVPDSVDKSDACARNSVDLSGDFERMGLLEGDSCCIMCDRGGQVLVCCETGCPIAVHDQCLKSGPKFDQMGNFYCPYCWYKIQVKRTKELREKAMLAKKALSDFLNSKVVGDDEEKGKQRRFEGNEVDVSGAGRDRNSGGCDNRHNNDEVGNLSMQVEEDGKNDGDNVQLADKDRHGIDDEHQACASPSVGNVHCGLEETRPGVESLDTGSIEKLNKKDVSEPHENEVGEDGEGIRVNDARQVNDGQHEEVVGGRENDVLEDEEAIQAEPLNAFTTDEEETHGGSPDASTKGVFDNVMVSEENQNRREEDEQNVPETTTLHTWGDTAPEVPAEDAVRSESSDLDNRPLSKRTKQVKRSKRKVEVQDVRSPKKVAFQQQKPRRQIVDSPQKSQSNSPAEGSTRNQSNKVTMPKKSRQAQQSPEQLTSLAFAQERRKRLHWTTEEEEMLKEGVQKFSSTANKNTPWRKILEFGRHVFDVTRTPIDLKDKWKNMAKQSSATNRR